MKKIVFSLITASTLLISATAPSAFAENNTHTAPIEVSAKETYSNAYQTVEHVASSKATAKSGSYKLKYNTNVRADAGTKNKVIIVGKKGATAKATHQKKVGKQTWYKVKVSGKSGWVLSTLLSEVKTTKTATSKATALSGKYKMKYNSNVRSGAGTKNKVVTVAKKGAIATATHQQKVGSQTWYKVKVNGKSGWVLNTLVSKYTAPKKKTSVSKVSSSSAASSKVVSTALSLKGTPYVFGGTTTRGFDCSGFTQYAFKKAGISLSRTTLTQFAETKTVTNPQPGDLVFFANTYRAGISHVGIYIGNNQFVHAGGAKAEVRSLSDSYWGPKFHSFKRK